ncbi:putative cytoplasmic dynein 1 intermediate chain 2 [Apostichopus japonicus]|uniref:Putative cytoplasmic dynein 1 intermediate chain 2 n=1 Tax=Stichopus japonicus TaxID=307972 RepID=A0A2G8KQR0_STIJA|nr:putative cytoplasmic dynein 1 intermediate chain 2 [Apostichopus japonicus]
MADRKAELERKKLRLQQIREEKKRKEEDRKKKEQQEHASKGAPAGGSSESELEKKRKDADELLRDLGLPESGPSTASASAIKTTPSDGGAQVLGASPQRKAKLSLSSVSLSGFPPKESISYSKETQTPVETQEEHEDEDILAETPEDNPLLLPNNQSQRLKKNLQNQVRINGRGEERIVHSEDFVRFLDRSTRVIERAIAEDADIFVDYGGNGEEDGEGERDAGANLSQNRQFFDDRWTRYRTVTCLDWSKQHPELLVASYSNNEESPHEPDGVALVWNTKFKKTSPEYIFHCQKHDIHTARTNNTSALKQDFTLTYRKNCPNWGDGAKNSQKHLLWSNSPLGQSEYQEDPVQRTPLSAAAHTHPVYCVKVVGTQNAHNLISVSTDGTMCSWSLDMLSQPQDCMQLKHKQSKPVAVTCMTFPHNDVNNFVVGSEDGSVYTASRHGSKAGINEAFEAHQGPVTGIDCHQVQGRLDFSHLFLSSSFDWTIKLWSLKHSSAIHSFEDNSDYVYDVQWSPVHPALFATVDGMGRLDLWNLNEETEVPTTSATLDGQTAMNRLRWNHSGQQIAVGDDEGRVWIYDVGEGLAQPEEMNGPD